MKPLSLGGNRRFKKFLLAICGVAGFYALGVLALQHAAPRGYRANNETRARARAINLAEIGYVSLQGPHLSFRGRDGRMSGPVIVKNREEMSNLLDGLLQSCREQEIELEPLQFGVPDLIQFWPKLEPEQKGSETFELNAGLLSAESGPKLTAVLGPYSQR